MNTIIRMEEILAAAAPKEVEISGWNPEERVRVKLKKPSMVNMISNGRVPNPLLGTVSRLLQGDPVELKKADEAETAVAVRHVVKEALISPSLDELNAAGVELTDDQYMEIYAWVLGGVAGLDRFRRITRGGAGEHVATDARAPERTDGPDGQLGGMVRR